VQVVGTFGPWPRTLLDTAPMEAIYDGVLLGAAVLCAMRAVATREERLPWALLAAGLALYAGGNLYWSFVLADLEDPPYPSIADGLWLSFYPLAYVAIVRLARARMPRLGIRLWLDGLIAALTVSALSAAVVFKAVRGSTGGDFWTVFTNLAYPIADMLLFGLVVGVMAAGRKRVDRTWAVLGLGLGVFAVCDSIYLYQVAEGTYETGTPLDRRRAARHRQDRDPAPAAEQDHPARRRRVGVPAPPHADRRAHRLGRTRARRRREDDPREPRALGRHGLPGRAGRPRHPARRPDRVRV
jgi:hypothetical protein